MDKNSVTELGIKQLSRIVFNYAFLNAGKVSDLFFKEYKIV